ncbi:MAG: hypothetical protein K0S57_104 [Ramlibacter sp.]|jgi:hypothetical protein|nr:hypothetical protein [Ramlibacter sp.]
MATAKSRNRTADKRAAAKSPASKSLKTVARKAAVPVKRKVATAPASDLMARSAVQLRAFVEEGLLAGPARRVRLAVHEGPDSFELDWDSSWEIAPLDTDPQRRARIKGYWADFKAVTTAVGDADDKAKKIRRLALYLSGMESTFGLLRDQQGNGPAKGLLQIQANKLRDIIRQARVMDNGGVAGRKDRVKLLLATQSHYTDENTMHTAAMALKDNAAAYPADSPFLKLARDNDEFACMLMRLQLMRAEGLPGDHDSCYKWWVSDWHSPTNLPNDAEKEFKARATIGDADLVALALN